MPEHGTALPTIEQLENELAALTSRRDELLRERHLHWRLGFSKDRVNLLLRQVEAKREKCEVTLREARRWQAKHASYGALEPGLNPHSSL